MWRRFDEVIWFEKPDRAMIEHFLTLKFKNIKTVFDPISCAVPWEGYSFAEIVCLQAIKAAVIERHKETRELDFRQSSPMTFGGSDCQGKLRGKLIVVSTEPISRIRIIRSGAIEGRRQYCRTKTSPAAIQLHDPVNQSQ